LLRNQNKGANADIDRSAQNRDETTVTMSSPANSIRAAAAAPANYYYSVEAEAS
jgi:hypothetical protein